ncbi:uncharacterized protein TRIADDRAFT_55453 [Trichoplax adhaerens]|uniref:AB hydrolase-1 domain-containing protein n=1 Tax=Trichoplax adhaerens TaxID=10228 RepID=B3RUY0_TRIAD|nr:hypothetical protein TRIADDRAFT_55453 [Trichoplax adhaerens]EDV25906.1 hypothetical protein TRIADDRAFT_55453 [Trichoplax adhaerens]|eukprot:XP_002111939.1 hypothetical protein TRIADDRAFT_55453 [Trichoplax adhaerens]
MTHSMDLHLDYELPEKIHKNILCRRYMFRLNELKDEWAIFRFNYGNAVANKFVYYTVDRINQASRHTRAIRQTKVPRYFIVGMEDPHVGDDIIGAWKRNVSADSIVELNGAGHYPYLEKPREMFNAYQNFRKSIMPNVTKSNSAPQSNESPRSEANNKSATNAKKDAKNQAKL